MPHVRIALIRHSKSCANHVRHLAGTEDREHPLVAASQRLRDPPLSAIGQRMARAYGPLLRDRLADAGFNIHDATIGSSHLRRAKQTAALLFPGHATTTFPHFTENGAIPENTPAGMRYRTPDWDAFVAHLSRHGDHEYVIIGHGSFLRSQAWPAVTGERREGRFGNLDGFIVEGDLTPSGIRVTSVKEIPYAGPVSPNGADQCELPTKVAALTRTMSRRRTQKKQRQQRGGYATSMPLGFYKDGAQLVGTRGEPTGVGLAGSNDTWARAPLQQTGGQRGGYPAGVVMPFVANGGRLLPVAAYMGYKMYKGSRKGSRRTRRR
jgi:hypothetical protein